MKISRRESLQLSAGALAALSGVSQAAAQNAPAGLADTPLRNIATLPLKPDGSAPEYTPQEAGTITGVLWRTKNQTPEIEFDYRKIRIKLDARGTAKLSGTLTFPDLEKLHGDRDKDEYDAIKGRQWDAAVDTSAQLPYWIRKTGEVLKDNVRQYIFVSSISAYPENSFQKPGDRKSVV